MSQSNKRRWHEGGSPLSPVQAPLSPMSSLEQLAAYVEDAALDADPPVSQNTLLSQAPEGDVDNDPKGFFGSETLVHTLEAMSSGHIPQNSPQFQATGSAIVEEIIANFVRAPLSLNACVRTMLRPAYGEQVNRLVGPMPLAHLSSSTYTEIMGQHDVIYNKLIIMFKMLLYGPRDQDDNGLHEDVHTIVAFMDAAREYVVSSMALTLRGGDVRAILPTIPHGTIGWKKLASDGQNSVFGAAYLACMEKLAGFRIDPEGMLYQRKFISDPAGGGLVSCFFYQRICSVVEKLRWFCDKEMSDPNSEFWKIISAKPNLIDSVCKIVVGTRNLTSIPDMKTDWKMISFMDGVLNIQHPPTFLRFGVETEGIPQNTSAAMFHEDCYLGPRFDEFRHALSPPRDGSSQGSSSQGSSSQDSEPEREPPTMRPRGEPSSNATVLGRCIDAILAIETPAFDVVLQTQAFSTFVSVMMLFMFGRLLHPTKCSTGDNYQVMPLIVGQGGTGKSSLLNVIDKWFPPGTICKFQNKIDENHGSSLVAGKKLVQLTELQDNTTIPKELIWELVSGNIIHINPKNKPSYNTHTESPVIAVGNAFPVNFVCSKMAAWRRMMVFFFAMTPSTIESDLEEKLKAESHCILLKAALVYSYIRKYIQLNHSNRLTEFIEQWDTEHYFFRSSVLMHRKASQGTDAFCRLLENGDIDVLNNRLSPPPHDIEKRLANVADRGLYMPLPDLIGLMRDNIQQHDETAAPGSTPRLGEGGLQIATQIFRLFITTDSRPWPPGSDETRRCEFVVGVGLREYLKLYPRRRGMDAFR